MEKVSILGPVGATFSTDAYIELSERFEAPELVFSEANGNFVSVKRNEEIIDSVLENGGYGVIAIETLVDGRISSCLESFICLLKRFDEDDCPINILGAIKMKISFCLMYNELGLANKVFGHPKALSACKDSISKHGLIPVETTSNGEAARLLTESQYSEGCFAVGPKSAATKYGLNILSSSVEDAEAFTTFLLIAPRNRIVSIGERNRTMIVFRLENQSGALVKALSEFSNRDLNLVQIHSVHVENGIYDFVIEIDFHREQENSLKIAIDRFKKIVKKYICFGPFEIC